MKKKKGYKFTNRKHPIRAIISSVLGFLSLFAYVFSILMAYRGRGDVGPQYGIAGLLALLYAGIGFYLGIASRFEKEKFYFFSYVGIVLNFVALLFAGFTIYLGLRG